MSLRNGILVGAGILLVVLAVSVIYSLTGQRGGGEAISASEATATPPRELAVEPISPTQSGETRITTPAAAVPILTPTEVAATSPTSAATLAAAGLPATIPTETPVPTAPLPEPTAAIACDRADPGSPLDVSIPEGTRMSPGEVFIKTWRVVNTGSCTWTPEYSLVFTSGTQMADTNIVSWGFDVAPGETLEISVNMVAPSAGGSYQSSWLLRNASGQQFGLGADGSAALIVRIDVVSEATAAPSATPSTASLSGRVLLNGSPVGGVNLTIEDQAYTTIASVQSGADGVYSFSSLPPSAAGYNLVFTQAANPQYPIEGVLSWSWIGPLALNGGVNLTLPDFEIGMAGFGPLNPPAESSYSAAAISPGSPLVFDWGTYPGANSYWIDLVMGEEQAPVWQSALVQGNSVAFEGLLFGGVPIQAGDYWWAVGAQRPLDSYKQTAYSFLVGFGIEP